MNKYKAFLMLCDVVGVRSDVLAAMMRSAVSESGGDPAKPVKLVIRNGDDDYELYVTDYSVSKTSMCRIVLHLKGRIIMALNVCAESRRPRRKAALSSIVGAIILIGIAAGVAGVFGGILYDNVERGTAAGIEVHALSLTFLDPVHLRMEVSVTAPDADMSVWLQDEEISLYADGRPESGAEVAYNSVGVQVSYAGTVSMDSPLEPGDSVLVEIRSGDASDFVVVAVR